LTIFYYQPLKILQFGGFTMKKWMILVLAACMAVGVAGTALAANSVELGGTASTVYSVVWDAVYANAPGGASAFVATGRVGEDPTLGVEAGTTLYAVSNKWTNAAGTEMRAVALQAVAGATTVGGPALVSGTSDTVYWYVQSPVAVGNTAATSGNTLYRINGGTGAVYWSTGIPGNGMTAGVGGNAALFDSANAGGTPYSLAPITIDTESSKTSGATIYGVTSGYDVNGLGTQTGVSVWAIDAETGVYTANSTGLSNVTGFTGASGVSVIHTAPVVSGNSLFVIGYSVNGAGSTLYQFNKNNIWNGPTTMATVNLNADLSDQWIPTPTVSGNSIFVADNNGAVSAYYTANLALQYSVDYAAATDTGVTASPVTDSKYIVLASTSSVSCFTLNKLSTNVSEWTYNFGANKAIFAAPSISSGYVWVTVNDLILLTSTTYRFRLSTGNIATVDTYGKMTFASPIVVGDTIWTVSYNPEVKKIKQADYAAGHAYWPQFKFDAAKTGRNTLQDSDETPDDDDSGCFITTIK
jgi:hypothetical protein